MKTPTISALCPAIICHWQRRFSRLAAIIAVAVIVACFPLHAAEPQPLMTTTGKTLVSEDFSAPGLPKTWDARSAPQCFSVVDGALRCDSGLAKEHTPFVVVRLPAHDVTVRFSAKFEKAGTIFLAVDGHSDAFGSNTHLIRLALTPTQATLDQKRGSPESKAAITVLNRKARADGEKIAQPTAGQLADASFYRTEELAVKPVNFGVGEWHDVLFEVSGNDLVLHFDDQPPIIAKATVADAAKSRLVFMVSGRGAALFKNVRASENTRRADWKNEISNSKTNPKP